MHHCSVYGSVKDRTEEIEIKLRWFGFKHAYMKYWFSLVLTWNVRCIQLSMSVKFTGGQCTIRVSHRNVRRTQEHCKGLGYMVVAYIHVAKGGGDGFHNKEDWTIHSYAICIFFIWNPSNENMFWDVSHSISPSFYCRNPSCLCYSYFLPTINM